MKYNAAIKKIDMYYIEIVKKLPLFNKNTSPYITICSNSKLHLFNMKNYVSEKQLLSNK